MSILKYIVEEYQDLQNAEKLVDELMAFIDKLNFMPNKYRAFKQEYLYFGFTVRIANYKKCCIFYTVDEVEREVRILRIILSNINVPEWLTL